MYYLIVKNLSEVVFAKLNSTTLEEARDEAVATMLELGRRSCDRLLLLEVDNLYNLQHDLEAALLQQDLDKERVSLRANEERIEAMEAKLAALRAGSLSSS